jgi:hypothetical protein
MAGLETKLKISDCQPQANRAVCGLSMVDGCTAGLGLPEGLNGKLEFVYRTDGMVGQATLTVNTDPRYQDYQKIGNAVDGWSAKNRPEEELAASQKLDREGGSISVKICKEYAATLGGGDKTPAP